MWHLTIWGDAVLGWGGGVGRWKSDVAFFASFVIVDDIEMVTWGWLEGGGEQN